MSINSAIENYYNGNLSDAKKEAKKHTLSKIMGVLFCDYCTTEKEALLIASYLKNSISFEELNDRLNIE